MTVDEAGDPQYSTFSLCAIDPATGQSGAAVTTRVPFVGRAVPWVRAGIGAVCTQASTMVEYGVRGLDLMAKGVEPQAAIAQLLADDAGRESRQLGMIDMQGRAAAHTGKGNSFWAGSRQGMNYTVQANIMVGPEVVEAVATVFEATEGTGMPLAERMILALEAGQAKGGDSRWGNLQSAAIRIADPNDPGRGNDFIALAIEVGEHAEPVGEMKRIYYTTQRRLGYRTFSQVEGPDVVELKRMLHAVGYWRPSLAAFPEPPKAPNAREMQDAAQIQPGAGRRAAGRQRAPSRRRLRARLRAVRRRDHRGGRHVPPRPQAQLRRATRPGWSTSGSSKRFATGRRSGTASAARTSPRRQRRRTTHVPRGTPSMARRVLTLPARAPNQSCAAVRARSCVHRVRCIGRFPHPLPLGRVDRWPDRLTRLDAAVVVNAGRRRPGSPWSCRAEVRSRHARLGRPVDRAGADRLSARGRPSARRGAGPGAGRRDARGHAGRAGRCAASCASTGSPTRPAALPRVELRVVVGPAEAPSAPAHLLGLVHGDQLTLVVAQHVRRAGPRRRLWLEVAARCSGALPLASASRPPTPACRPAPTPCASWLPTRRG